MGVKSLGVEGLGLRVCGLGFGIRFRSARVITGCGRVGGWAWGLESGVEGFGFGVSCLGFHAKGFVFSVSGLGPLSCEHGTYTTVKARFWPWLNVASAFR